jgi:L-lactate dehydrogenase (cytochrome)
VGARRARELQWKEADRLGWEQVRRLRDRWSGPFVLKGLLAVPEAEQAARIGVDAIVLSNHGGRQLDCVPAPIDLVGEVVDAVGDRMQILLDSGVRRGTDVLKALALGAAACLVGRPYLYGPAGGGEAGVERALDILRTEIRRDLMLLGAASAPALDRSFVRAVVAPSDGPRVTGAPAR